ncbi:hypothetical protein HK100_006495 [Physocladia obscura]|uniref:Uncharacterized protein n=1 Tax=Physocladia obscura TaxID=109957 RepID=A0AAD5SQD6_9FUNG|nr:hypothetical protein HK100_006495 [Physocladia obscura]
MDMDDELDVDVDVDVDVDAEADGGASADNETLSLFAAITGSTSDAVARAYLRLADASLEAAVALYLDNPHLAVAPDGPSSRQREPESESGPGPGSGSGSAPRPGPEREGGSVFGAASGRLDDRRPIAAVRDTLVGRLRDFDDLGGPDDFGDDDDDDYRDFGPLGHNANASAADDRFSFVRPDPHAPADSKTNRLAKMFATPSEIMFRGSFDEVIALCTYPTRPFNHVSLAASIRPVFTPETQTSGSSSQFRTAPNSHAKSRNAISGTCHLSEKLL